MKKAEISVIIPTVGRVNMLLSCLQSIYSQSIIPIEIVIVDNSEDRLSKKIKAEFYKKLCAQNSYTSINLIYIREKRKGVSFAQNAGLRTAKYDLVVFIDDDCVAVSGWMEKVLRSARLNKNSVIQGISMNGIPENIYSCVEFFNTQIFFQSGEYKSYNHLCYTNLLDTKNCIIRKSLFRKLPIFDIRLDKYSDIDFGLKILDKGIKIIIDKTLKVRHFGRPDMKSHFSRELERGKYYRRFQKKWQYHILHEKNIMHKLQQMKEKKMQILKKKLKRKLLIRKSIFFRLFFHLILFFNPFFVWSGYLFEKFFSDNNFTSIFLPRNSFTRHKRIQ